MLQLVRLFCAARQGGHRKTVSKGPFYFRHGDISGHGRHRWDVRSHNVRQKHDPDVPQEQAVCHRGTGGARRRPTAAESTASAEGKCCCDQIEVTAILQNFYVLICCYCVSLPCCCYKCDLEDYL